MSSFTAFEEQAMAAALCLAATAQQTGEVPVGAVIIRSDEIIATGHNQPITTHDPTAHAEIVALRRAATVLGNYRLTGCTLVVTLEPCAMCVGAMVHARLQTVIYGAADSKAGALGGAVNLLTASHFNHKFAVKSGLLAAECGDILRKFFLIKRTITES